MKTKPEVEQKNRPAFIKVSEEVDGGKINNIQCGYSVYVAEKKEGDKYYNFFIPAFKIHYFAESEEEGKKIGEVSVNAFFDYWLKDQGKKAFFDQIKKLGFIEVKRAVKSKKDFRFKASKPNIPLAYNHKAFDISKKLNALAA